MKSGITSEPTTIHVSLMVAMKRASRAAPGGEQGRPNQLFRRRTGAVRFPAGIVAFQLGGKCAPLDLAGGELAHQVVPFGAQCRDFGVEALPLLV
jgi:hypothetical protein